MLNQINIDPLVRKAVSCFVERLDGRYDIGEIWLYGSRSRGDARDDSDADVALILDGVERPTLPIGVEMAGESFDVLMETGILVSPLPVFRRTWEQPALHSNPYLIANIKRDGISL